MSKSNPIAIDCDNNAQVYCLFFCSYMHYICIQTPPSFFIFKFASATLCCCVCFNFSRTLPRHTWHAPTQVQPQKFWRVDPIFTKGGRTEPILIDDFKKPEFCKFDNVINLVDDHSPDNSEDEVRLGEQDDDIITVPSTWQELKNAKKAKCKCCRTEKLFLAKHKKRRFRGWCGTLNNFTKEQRDTLADWFKGTKNIEYAFIAEEVGESGTPHLQFAFWWTQKYTGKHFTGVRQVMQELDCSEAHIEPAEREPVSSYNYIILGKKHGKTVPPDWSWFKKMPAGQGKRKDKDVMTDIIQDAKDGKLKPHQLKQMIWKNASGFSVSDDEFDNCDPTILLADEDNLYARRCSNMEALESRLRASDVPGSQTSIGFGDPPELESHTPPIKWRSTSGVCRTSATKQSTATGGGTGTTWTTPSSQKTSVKSTADSRSSYECSTSTPSKSQSKEDTFPCWPGPLSSPALSHRSNFMKESKKILHNLPEESRRCATSVLGTSNRSRTMKLAENLSMALTTDSWEWAIEEALEEGRRKIASYLLKREKKRSWMGMDAITLDLIRLSHLVDKSDWGYVLKRANRKACFQAMRSDPMFSSLTDERLLTLMDSHVRKLSSQILRADSPTTKLKKEGKRN